MNAWSLEGLSAARSGGVEISPLVMARCDVRAGRVADAAREYRAALTTARDDSERFYLELCQQRLKP